MRCCGGSFPTCFLSPAGAPAIATSSGQQVPGNGRCSLKDLSSLPPKRSETLAMLEQSSKCGESDHGGAADDVLLCTPTALEKTPGKLSSVAHTPREAAIEISESPKPIAASPKVRSPGPGSAKCIPSPNIKRQLFGPREKLAPKKSATAPKPEGYWRLPAQLKHACIFSK